MSMPSKNIDLHATNKKLNFDFTSSKICSKNLNKHSQMIVESQSKTQTPKNFSASKLVKNLKKSHSTYVSESQVSLDQVDFSLNLENETENHEKSIEEILKPNHSGGLDQTPTQTIHTQKSQISQISQNSESETYTTTTPPTYTHTNHDLLNQTRHPLWYVVDLNDGNKMFDICNRIDGTLYRFKVHKNSLVKKWVEVIENSLEIAYRQDNGFRWPKINKIYTTLLNYKKIGTDSLKNKHKQDIITNMKIFKYNM